MDVEPESTVFLSGVLHHTPLVISSFVVSCAFSAAFSGTTDIQPGLDGWCIGNVEIETQISTGMLHLT